MRKGLIISIVVVLAAGSLAGVMFYRKNAQKESQLADQLKQIQALNKKISMLDQETAGFQKQSAADQKRIKSLEDEKLHVAQLEKTLKEKDGALAAAQKECDALRDSMSDLEAKLKFEQASSLSQGEKLQTAQAQVEKITTDFEKAMRSRTDLETQVAKLKGELIKGREEAQGLAMELKREQTEKQTLKRELAQAHDNITSDQIEFQNQQRELEAAQSRIVNLQKEIQKHEKLKAALEETVSDYKVQIIGLTGKVDKAEAEKDVMSGRLSTLETEKAVLGDKVSGLTTQNRTLRKDHYEGQLAFQNKQKELEAAQSEIVILKGEVQENQAVKAILEKEVSGFKAQLLDLKDTHQRVQTIQKEIQKTAEINSLLKNQISILQLQLNNYQEKTFSYASTIEEKESQLKLIVSNLNNCLVNSKDVEVSLQTAQSQVVNLMGIVEQARAEQVVMNKQLSNLESEKAEMALKLTEVKKTYDTLIRELHDKIETKEAVIEDCDKKFSVTFIDRVLFYSGKASITSAGQDVLKKTGDILSKMRFGVIRIAGHTDNVPIRRGWRGRFPTNWELSSARAAAVARFFQKKSNISPENIEVVGFGEHQPIASNTTREGRAKNRRVEITIAPMGPMVRTP